jgi:type I restriction enzyme S subunit
MAIRVIAWHSDYVFYWLQHVGRTFEQVASGLIPGISREDILGLLILLPPLLEQRKIAEILGTWDAAIERVTRLIAALQRRKQGLMQRLLTGKVRFPEFVRSEAKQQTRYTSLPAEWNYVAISEIAREVSLRNTNGDALSVLSCTKYAGLVDSLSYFGRQIFSEDTSDYKVVKRAQFAYATNHIEEGSIGYQDLCDVALISPMYTVFETTGGVDDAFLYRLLKTELYRHIFEVNTSGTVNRRGRLGWEDFARIKVPLPSEAEQRKIAEFFATVDQEINLQQQRLAALRQQKQGLMQRLLTGQVRVQV